MGRFSNTTWLSGSSKTQENDMHIRVGFLITKVLVEL
jgi:hypothetical protein